MAFDNPSDKDKEFAIACDELKSKFKLQRLIVVATPEEMDHELVYISISDTPLFILEAAINLQNFYMAREHAEYERSKEKALGVLALVEKIASGRMNKPQN
jgi:hypothetical protein